MVFLEPLFGFEPESPVPVLSAGAAVTGVKTTVVDADELETGGARLAVALTAEIAAVWFQFF